MGKELSQFFIYTHLGGSGKKKPKQGYGNFFSSFQICHN